MINSDLKYDKGVFVTFREGNKLVKLWVRELMEEWGIHSINDNMVYHHEGSVLKVCKQSGTDEFFWIGCQKKGREIIVLNSDLEMVKCIDTRSFVHYDRYQTVDIVHLFHKSFGKSVGATSLVALAHLVGVLGIFAALSDVIFLKIIGVSSLIGWIDLMSGGRLLKRVLPKMAYQHVRIEGR